MSHWTADHASSWERSFAPSLDVGGLGVGGGLPAYGSGTFGDDGFHGSDVYHSIPATAGSPGMLIPMEGGGVAPMSSTSDLAFSSMHSSDDAQYGMDAYGSAGLMQEALMSHGHNAQGSFDSVTSLWQPQGSSFCPVVGLGNRQPKIEKKVPSTIACRYGIKCHSKTCLFWHPQGKGGAEGSDALDPNYMAVSTSPSRKGSSSKM